MLTVDGGGPMIYYPIMTQCVAPALAAA